MSGLASPPTASSPSTRKRMQAVGKRDTPIERRLRSLLHRRGLRFRIDMTPLRSFRRRADIVFPRSKVAVFVDGCFWHGCPTHFRLPKANAAWWKEKIRRNWLRDRDTDQHLAEAGWQVIRMWAHEDVEECARRVEEAVRERLNHGFH